MPYPSGGGGGRGSKASKSRREMVKEPAADGTIGILFYTALSCLILLHAMALDPVRVTRGVANALKERRIQKWVGRIWLS